MKGYEVNMAKVIYRNVLKIGRASRFQCTDEPMLKTNA
ncbi:hypothetical protein SAMN05878482_10135 [Peribacillus simplex]|uniref:Uncharacterized protein n=1 Tax=Peribacillus simplex TaxID=1478 RepID=A0A9X8WGC7_9BACI|nr:hypothetical protein SAMN05878482_10135 [Peribacillus simplex]